MNIKDSLPVIASFWYGSDLTWLEKLFVSSLTWIAAIALFSTRRKVWPGYQKVQRFGTPRKFYGRLHSISQTMIGYGSLSSLTFFDSALSRKQILSGWILTPIVFAHLILTALMFLLVRSGARFRMA